MRWSSTEMTGKRRGRGSGSGSSGTYGAPHHSTGALPGVGAVALHDDAVDDRGHEPVGALQHALRSRGEVVHDLHLARRHRERVDEVEVGLEPGFDRTAVAQAVDRGGLAGEDLHRGLERDRAAWPLAHPVRQEERRVAGVADEVDVGAAVAQAQHGLRVDEQLGAHVEAPAVATEEVVHERLAVVGDGPLVEELLRVAALRRPTARRGWSTDRARTPAPGATGTPRRPAPASGRAGAARRVRDARRGWRRARRARPCGRRARRRAGARSRRSVGRPRNGCDVRRPQNRPCPCELICGTMRRAVGVLALHAREPIAPVAAGAAAERERDRDAALARRGREHVDLAVPHGAVGAGGAGHDRAVDRVGRTLARGADQRGELVGGGEGAGDLASVDRLVQLEPVGADTPTAPASTPSATRSAMRAMSSSVAGSLAAPRSPIT